MIPPANIMQDESLGKENEREQHETPQSPAPSASQQETKVVVPKKMQKLKRSLSFKTKSMRSKSADNFFQRNNNDAKLSTELLSDNSSSTCQLSVIGVAVAHPVHPIQPVQPVHPVHPIHPVHPVHSVHPIHHAPPLSTSNLVISNAPPAIPCAPPSLVYSPGRHPLAIDPTGHGFMEHIFKKPTFCDVCNHMIVGTTSKHVVMLAGNTAKHGLRCKACKMSIHHKCEKGVGSQRCQGKLPKGFRRYYSSPLLITEQFGCIKEVMPIACGSKVDPVYEALRFGTSLAQRDKRASVSESPHRNSTSDLAQVPEEDDAHSSRHELTRKHSDNVFTSLENGTEPIPYCHVAERKPDDSPERKWLQKDTLQLNTYVALFTFTPQESEDLEMRPGDRIVLADDSNDDWWKGMIEDRIGFFPAAFAHQVKTGDRVFRCHRTFIGCKEQGQITLKEGQICVSGEDEHSGFIRVASGKKRGYVPCDVLENI
ncbi:SH3 and cysteine-rich domain-containing protein isoform X1 [Oncorhynchus keta]|uniref:SH3 and cysteine-rich domain-containing protein isoform X1 n=2 Tax=Oncorhynchus TaxID=8016 RepID=UPI0015F8D9EE|nr:SH3 and cysteine-rich domain-containing protein isoform X1 [Oncorhynchus keta]